MNLHDLITSRIEYLYQEYERLSSMTSNGGVQEDINRLRSIKDQIDESVENLCYLLPSDFQDIVDVTDPGFLSKFHEVQSVLEGIYEKGLKMKISAGQSRFINRITSALDNRIEKLQSERDYHLNHPDEVKEKLSMMENKIFSYEDLDAKVTDPDDMTLLDIEDFHLLDEAVNDPNVSFQYKASLLKQIIAYNDAILHQHKVVSLADMDQVKSLLSEFQVPDKVQSLLSRNKDEVLSHIHLGKAKSILAYMQSKNILTSFTPDALLTIAVYGDLETLKSRYESFSSVPKTLFSIPSVWINNMSSSSIRKKSSAKQRKSSSNNNSVLFSAAHRVSYDDLVKNEEFLKSLGFDVSIAQGRGLSALQQPHNRVVQNYNLLRDFGFFDGRDQSLFPVSIFTSSHIFEKANRFIELGLLGNDNFNYVYYFPSAFVSFREEAFAKLYALKQENNRFDYYDKISSEHRIGTLKTDVHLANGEFALGDDLANYVKDNFVSITDKIPNASLFDEVLSQRDYGLDTGIEDDENICYLENNFREGDNPYYTIGGVDVSRYKVLSSYGALKSEGYMGEDAFLYSAVSGMYLTEDSFKAMKDDIDRAYSRGGDSNGLSRKI